MSGGLHDWMTVDCTRDSEPSPHLEPSVWPALPESWELADEYNISSHPASEPAASTYAAVLARTPSVDLPSRSTRAPAERPVVLRGEVLRSQPKRERLPRWNDAYARKPNEAQLNAC
eukprot:CAMPEP_0174721670 /NCGR_PEP_ID=MMETSP1094-20130205/36847_1 /TAXON_ID=156173 /ORGANISM="Chrysochromulina brevifilum, Strain UTEX LB 985" /LENGTH=116 /DNA_ID=CAMNT_0015922407 /DNA_START=22 /DNA_END=372 /DNA_ORIENTATION=+